MSAPSLLGVAAAALALALPIVSAAEVLEAAQRTAGAADSAALAAADADLGYVSADPCGLAAEVTAAAGVTLESCELDRVSSQVRISVSVQTIFGTVHSRARAGPPVE